jgi:hypothetical protein
MLSASGWEGSDAPLIAAFQIEVPDFGTAVGGRLLAPVVVFQNPLNKMFQISHREHPVYLDFGSQELDELTVEIPQGYQIENLPSMQGARESFASYEISPEKLGSGLKVTRRLIREGYFFEVAKYPGLRNFYDFVRNNDEQQAVLKVAP